MKKISITRPANVIATATATFTMLFLLALPARADDEATKPDGFHLIMDQMLSDWAVGHIDIKPYVSASASYDDNLFRLSSKSVALAALGSEDMSDRFYRTEAGANVDWTLNRQHLLLNLDLNQNTFERFSFLNNHGYAYKLGWGWKLNSHLSGELSLNEDQSMGGFSEIQNPVLNLRAHRSQLATANWDFHPRWRLGVSRDDSDFTNSQVSFRGSDRNELTYQAGIQYTSAEGNRLGLSEKQIDAQYLMRDPISLALFGNVSRQRELALDGIWLPTNKMRIQAHIAKVERAYEAASQRNFDGWAGSTNILWSPTNKFSITASAGRSLYGIDDAQASFVQSDVLSLAPSWAFSNKLVLQADSSYEDRSYLGAPIFIGLGSSQREDRIKNNSLNLTYTPYRKIHLQLSAINEVRNSNATGIGYQDNTASANLRVDF